MIYILLKRPLEEKSKQVSRNSFYLFIFLSTLLLTGIASPNENASEKRQNHKEELNELISLLKKDPIKASYAEGLAYYHGLLGVNKNSELAADYFYKAAARGHAESQYILGEIYRLGEGRELNERKALLWLKRAAVNGHIDGQYNLGVAYVKGMGTKIDERKAFAWFAQAAHGHNHQAQNSLAWMYYKGIVPKKNKIFAALWATIAVANKSDDAFLVQVLSELNFDQQSIVKKFTKKCMTDLTRNNFKHCHPPHEITQITQVVLSENVNNHDLIIQEHEENVPDHVEKLVDLMGALYPKIKPLEENDLSGFSKQEKMLIEKSQNPREFIKWLTKYPNATDFQKEHAAPMDGYTAEDVTLDGDGISIRVK